MYEFCISVPVRPQHLDCTIAQCSPQALTTTKCSTWPPSATQSCSTLHFSAAHRVQIVVNSAHCSSESYTPVGASTILADVICPMWHSLVPSPLPAAILQWPERRSSTFARNFDTALGALANILASASMSSNSQCNSFIRSPT